MALTIYGTAMSRAFRPMWMAKELGVPYDNVPVNTRTGETRRPDFLKINPNGHVPAIKDDDLILWESLAINLYLAKKHGGPLAPANLTEDAKATMWSMWALTEVEAHGVTLLQHTMMLPEDKRNPALIQQAKDAVKAPLGVLEAALAGTEYLLGNRFTVADLNVSSVLVSLAMVKYDLGPYPKVAAWLQKCTGRKASLEARGLAAQPA